MAGGGVSDEDNREICKAFSLRELEDAVREMKNDTASRPDGFSLTVFKEFWDFVKMDILEMLNKLHMGELDLATLNYGVLALIPKIKGVVKIKQYQPICLLNVVYKIITKVLTRRLMNVASKIISESQTTFIPGRHILDRALILHEVLHQLKITKHKGIVPKLDFEKAYDKVNWKFLVEVLNMKGFAGKWISG